MEPIHEINQDGLDEIIKYSVWLNELKQEAFDKLRIPAEHIGMDKPKIEAMEKKIGIIGGKMFAMQAAIIAQQQNKAIEISAKARTPFTAEPTMIIENYNSKYLASDKPPPTRAQRREQQRKQSKKK